MTDFAYLDGHHAVIGMSDAGKTWTAKVGAEELLRQRRHTLIIDPLGVWYGLRSSIDGKAPGFDIPIFGGPHGDVAIRPRDGAAIAAIVVDQRVSAILDLSLMTNGPDQRWFVRDLVSRLRERPQGNFHFVVDEADEFVPEKVRDDVAYQLQEDMLWIAKKGRSSGWIQTLITQRTADLAKSALTQCQTIFAHQLAAPQDQKPFLDYVRTKGTKAELVEIQTRLASLQRGERYKYSPRAHILELGRSPALTTFDSSATPPAGSSRLEPRTLAQLDVSAIAAALAPKPTNPDDTIPTDPIEALVKGGAVGAMIVERDERVRELEGEIARLSAELETSRWVARRALELADAINRDVTTLLSLVDEQPDVASTPAADPAPTVHVPTALVAPATTDRLSLPPRRLRILDGLAWSTAYLKTDAVPRAVAAWAADTTPASSTFEKDLSAMRTSGLIDYPSPGVLSLTPEGDRYISRRPLRSDRTELRRVIIIKLPPRRIRILDALWDGQPHSREALAAAVGTTARSSTFEKDLSAMRTLTLLDYPSQGSVRLAEVLR